MKNSVIAYQNQILATHSRMVVLAEMNNWVFHAFFKVIMTRICIRQAGIGQWRQMWSGPFMKFTQIANGLFKRDLWHISTVIASFHWQLTQFVACIAPFWGPLHLPKMVLADVTSKDLKMTIAMTKGARLMACCLEDKFDLYLTQMHLEWLLLRVRREFVLICVAQLILNCFTVFCLYFEAEQLNNSWRTKWQSHAGAINLARSCTKG